MTFKFYLQSLLLLALLVIGSSNAFATDVTVTGTGTGTGGPSGEASAKTDAQMNAMNAAMKKFDANVVTEREKCGKSLGIPPGKPIYWSVKMGTMKMSTTTPSCTGTGTNVTCTSTGTKSEIYCCGKFSSTNCALSYNALPTPSIF